MRVLRALWTALLLVIAVAAAAAQDYRAGDISVEEPHIRAVPAGAPVAGGYVMLRNEGGEADRLIAVEADFAGKTELHTMSMQDGIMRMRPLPDGIEIPAGGKAELSPSGLHIMFMQLQSDLAAGDRRRATLIFEKAGRLEVTFDVRAMGHGH